jgi:phosphatidate phosphatase APP1
MIKTLIQRAALALEWLADRVFRRTAKGRDIDPYIGFTTPEHTILRGQVLSKVRHATAAPGQSRLTNFRQMIGMFLTDEVRGETVRCGDVTAVTDEEGYFTLLLPNGDQAGWRTEIVTIAGRDATHHCEVMAPADTAEFIIISDIDDTMIQTGAYSLLRNLFTSFTGNAGTRIVFSDAVALMNRLHNGGQNPVYYVSSSPWNLHHFLLDLFKRSELVPGPMFLRDLGLSETKMITAGHGSHKGHSIDTILAANPDLPAILLGDTGQHDALIYTDAVHRHPGRIIAIGLRTPGSGLDDADRADLKALARAHTPFYTGKTFDGFIEQMMVETPDKIASVSRK